MCECYTRWLSMLYAVEYAISYFESALSCHPEKSEGSHNVSRFFANAQNDMECMQLTSNMTDSEYLEKVKQIKKCR